ncbi:helix-turn-helix transcriptional regulator [Mucilaginibacter sp.]|uniref:helix-turn-helix domain-containing protein n=1 Tax=Mucilaginibacter sp. TaxID=1882438 RepID=UPI0025D4A54E|nr:helix-turn-helix transcriptional regulator [Mucilaginibacter sp.]
MMRGNIIGKKIRTLRELKGYSQDYVAGKLDIAQNTYSKIESNQTKLNTDILERIAEVLEVSITDLLSEEPIVLNFNGVNHGAQGKFDLIEHFHSGQKELYEKIIASKDEEIARMQKIIDALLGKK